MDLGKDLKDLEEDMKNTAMMAGSKSDELV